MVLTIIEDMNQTNKRFHDMTHRKRPKAFISAYKNRDLRNAKIEEQAAPKRKRKRRGFDEDDEDKTEGFKNDYNQFEAKFGFGVADDDGEEEKGSSWSNKGQAFRVQANSPAKAAPQEPEEEIDLVGGVQAIQQPIAPPTQQTEEVPDLLGGVSEPVQPVQVIQPGSPQNPPQGGQIDPNVQIQQLMLQNQMLAQQQALMLQKQ